MSNEALKELSLQYIRGEISKPEYRQKRKEIIDQATLFPETEPANFPDTEPAKPDIQSSSGNQSSNTKNILRTSVISAVIVATLIVLYSAI